VYYKKIYYVMRLERLSARGIYTIP